MRRIGPLYTCACFVVLCLATARPAPAQGDAVQGVVEYVKAYGDTYDGVTTDDGDHLGSSFALRAIVTSGRFAALYLFHRDETASLTNATLPSGAPGTTINYPAEQIVLPLFTAVNAQSEFRLEYQPWRGRVFLGVASANSFNNYAFPRLTGVGVGVEVQPNPAKRISPYGSFFFFPNQTGTYPLAAPSDPTSGSVHSAFYLNELLLGAAAKIGKTGLSLRFGYFQDEAIRKTGTFNFVRDGPFVGFAYTLR